MPCKLAIFDFDGTLADSLPWFVAAMNEAAERYGFRHFEAGDAERLRGRSAREVMQFAGIPMWKVPAITRFMRARMGEDVGAISLFPGVAAMLEALVAAGVGLSVVSTNAERNVRHVLGPRHAALVRHYGCGASMFGKGPKLRQALAAARVAPTEAICIGDEIRDFVAARAEGIPFGAVAWGFTDGAALAGQGPEAYFARVEEIVAHLAPRRAEGRAS